MTILAKLPKRKRRRPRRRRLKSLAIAPTLMTLANLLCGFAAIHFALLAMYGLGFGDPGTSTAGGGGSLLNHPPGWFLWVGAVLVLVGGIFDFFDGLIARVTRTASEFGGQLDSLADAITFGVAPATLMVVFMSLKLTTEAILPSPISEDLVGRATWMSAAIYVAFAAVRLARFNVEHAKVDFDYRMFRGLPSPGAACVVVALILFQRQMGTTGQAVTVYSMPFVAVALAFLMISRIPYRRFHRAYFLGEKPFSQVMTFVALVAVFWLIKVPTLLLLVLWYAASGPLFTFLRIVRDQRRAATERETPVVKDETEERKLA
jgi:CDP-diacylglycerol--serine O-phosphatidyltransferase